MMVDSAVPGLGLRRQRHAQRRVIAFTLLAPVCDMLLFLAKAIHGPAERFGFDTFFAPEGTSFVVLGARYFQRLQMLAQRLTQAVQKRTIVLQLDRIDRRSRLG